MVESSPTAENTSTQSTPRHGRRARQLTPEEQAELDRLRAEYEQSQAESATADEAPEVAVDPEASAPAEAAADVPAADAPEQGVSSARVVPAEPATPSVRRFGRRARIIEVDDALAPGETATAAGVDPDGRPIPTDADGVELGEMPEGEAPDPRPAPRFEGRVLHRPERGAGNPLVWIVWALVALAVILVIVLLVSGVLGSGDTSALSAVADGTVGALSSAVPTTGEVIAA